MFEDDFWLDCACFFRQQATAARERAQREELLDLARVCDAVACKIEEHAPSG